MVCEASEFQRAKDQIAREIERARKMRERLPEKLYVGAMLEVPSLLFELEQIFEVADFVSVGSNDLLQFVFAADRSNPAVARRYDALSPAALHVIAAITEASRLTGTAACFCGEMAGRPLEAMALIGLGATALSMQPTMIGPVKLMVRSLDTRPLAALLRRLGNEHLVSARDALKAFAESEGVVIERPV
jgi:phosphotransferase system enzyme I (PtsP)